MEKEIAGYLSMSTIAEREQMRNILQQAKIAFLLDELRFLLDNPEAREMWLQTNSSRLRAAIDDSREYLDSLGWSIILQREDRHN